MAEWTMARVREWKAEADAELEKIADLDLASGRYPEAVSRAADAYRRSALGEALIRSQEALRRIPHIAFNSHTGCYCCVACGAPDHNGRCQHRPGCMLQAALLPEEDEEVDHR